MNPLLEQFILEARENLKFIEQNLEELENADGELLNSIFRAAHTLKGGSGIVGFDAVRNITHSAEDLLDMLRSKKITYKKSMQGALFDAFDEVLNLVEAAESNDDIVEGNAEIEATIVSRMKEEMGICDEVCAAFKVPFREPQHKGCIIDRDFGFLKSFDLKIPYKYDPITAENLDDLRLYAIMFDASKDCMVFGNDPVYVVSLLKGGFVSLDFCLSEESAKEILGGYDDEGLELKAGLIAYSYGSYSEVQDAIYNFLDDVYILPLDIETMLSITQSELSGGDIIKGVYKDLKRAIDNKSSDQALGIIEKSIDLLNGDSFEYRFLKRLAEVIPLVSLSELENLGSALAKLGVDDTGTDDTPQVTQEEPYEDEKSLAVDPEKIKEVTSAILKQQLEVLNLIPSDTAFKRASGIMGKYAAFFKKPLEAKNREQLMNFIKSELGMSTGEVKEEIKSEAQSKPASAPVSSQPKLEEPRVAASTQEEPKKAAPAVTQKEAQSKDVIGKVVKVDQESIDMLMSVVGELLVAKNSLPYLAESVNRLDSESIRRAILEKYSFVNRLTNQLQDLIMSMRMLPISYVFDRYPKLVRDISKKLDKQVKLIQEGGETRLDKNMIEMLADPLVHIVRNSLDHGIELPSERKSKGKDEVGTITMKAYPQSDKVIIEIIDDGKGIDTNRVVNKVLEKGLLSPEKIEAMSEQEKVELVMMPGLSTAETITEFSGRGVGMDVVKKSIEGFGGSIEIKSIMGVGTTIKLSIPVSLAVTTLLHVLMKGTHYGLPMEYVSETVKIDRNEITYLHNEPFIYIREHVIPLLYIEKMLEGLKDSEPLSIVVLNIKGNQLAVAVNELLGQLDVVQKPLEGILSNHPLISGTALLGNGQIIMALDPYGLLSLCETLKAKEIK